MITTSEIVVGATYAIKGADPVCGPAKLPRRVIRHDPGGHLSGGNIRVATVRSDGTEGPPKTWAVNYFIKHAVKIDCEATKR